MLLAGKIGWAGITLTFLTTGMLGQGIPRHPTGSDLNREGVAVFVVKNEIKKVQETLRGKGYYGGKADGVFGLRTRASIRAYQKAENLPVTGQVDTRTAAGLGVRPESTWGNSQSAGRQIGHSSDIVPGGFRRDKPSAGIKRAESRPGRNSRKEVSGTTAVEDNRAGGANRQQEPDR
ncbi:MAG: peptidoglycan-binding domain-containing protein [Candidatus Sulfotelmatobacter sp.]